MQGIHAGAEEVGQGQGTVGRQVVVDHGVDHADVCAAGIRDGFEINGQDIVPAGEDGLVGIERGGAFGKDAPGLDGQPAGRAGNQVANLRHAAGFGGGCLGEGLLVGSHFAIHQGLHRLVEAGKLILWRALNIGGRYLQVVILPCLVGIGLPGDELPGRAGQAAQAHLWQEDLLGGGRLGAEHQRQDDTLVGLGLSGLAGGRLGRSAQAAGSQG